MSHSEPDLNFLLWHHDACLRLTANDNVLNPEALAIWQTSETRILFKFAKLFCEFRDWNTNVAGTAGHLRTIVDTVVARLSLRLLALKGLNTC